MSKKLFMEDQIWNYIIKRITKVETEESKIALDHWLNANADNVSVYNETVALWELTGLMPSNKNTNSENFIHPIAEKNRQRSFKRIMRYSIAASLAVVTSLSVYYLSRSKSPLTNQAIAYTVHKALNGKMIKLQLPDSSTVWLNGGSELRYPKNFTAGETRAIQLVGEAFFDVTHNEKQPFVVESGELKTVVYGTSFNVSSYKDGKQSSVTVKTGKVGVMLVGDSLNKPTMLLPGNRLVYHRANGEMEQSNTATDEIANWLNGDLVFDQATPAEVFATLARKFDVEFKYNEADFEGCTLTAKFPNQHLKVIMKTIGNSLDFKFNEQGKTIQITGGQPCN
ncbi:MAG: FecR family protein [Chitinophagaceae bacterium]|nr:MAG: FecR family protein [Chitinophagaceae bacterium]